VKSYRDLPYRLAEAGTVYRNELSGVTYGLTRVRALTQNDAHIYCTKDQLQDEMKQVLKLTKECLGATGMKEFWYRLSLPDFKKNPEKYTGDPKIWAQAAQDIEKVLKASKEKYVAGEGEAAFYGPKIDIQIKNAHGKEETLATIQVDIVVPQRIGLTYINEKGEKEYPIVIHRAPLGSYERYISFLLEQTKGNLPLWLAPVQVKVLSFTDKNNKAAQKIVSQLKEAVPSVRVEADLRNETVQAKVRDAEVMKIPYIIVIGDKEEEKGTLAVREHGAKKPAFGVTFKDFVKQLADELENKK
jgi:threonyl-tRNA synthetase